MAIYKTITLLALAAAVTVTLSWGQSYQGGIRGKVLDQAAANITTAKVTLIDEATSAQRATVTNDQGEYVFNAVDPAAYTISVETPGFKKFERKGVILATQAFLTIDVGMELGNVNESVNVTEEVPLMETSNASTGQVVDRQKLVDLPNLGRNPFMMAKIAPNVAQVGDPRFNRMQDQSGSSQISIAGGPVRGNNYLLDGVPISDSQNRAVIIPTIEAVQEVKIQANTYDAEMGRTGGGVFNTYLKSGSNEIHGSLFGYMRDSSMLANSFFNNRGGIARPDQPFRNYGGAIGGPVVIPKVYNGKNKTFWWIGAESYRQKSALTRDIALPTAAEVNGDFSQSYVKGGNNLQVIFDPLTTRLDANGKVVRDAFPGNIIPVSRQSPIGRAIASYYPTPQRAPRYFGDNDYTSSAVLADRADQGTAKLDHEVFSWWHANLSYLHYKSREPGGNVFGTIASPNPSLLLRKVDATQVNNIFTPSPTMVVSVRYGFNRFPNTTKYESDGFDPASLGLSPDFLNQLQITKRFPTIGMQTLSALGGGAGSWSVYHSKNLLASVSKFQGKHSLKAGFDYRLLHIDFINFGGTGTFNFSDSYTRSDPNSGGYGGADVASLLLGYPITGSATIAGKFYQYVKYYSGYLQDDIRVSSRLTLNVGLRYEYESGIQESKNQFVIGFDRSVINPVAASVSGIVPHGGLQYAGIGGNGTSCCNPSATKFGPRIGFAWQLSQKTTVRGGYGIFWAPIAFSGLNTFGYNAQTDLIGSYDNGLTPNATLSNPFPNGLLHPVGNSNGLASGIGQTLNFYDQNAKPTLVHQFSFDLQHELPGNVLVAVGYVGSRTSHLILGTGTININQLDPQFLSMGPSLLKAVPNPFFNNGGAGVVGSATVQQAQLLKPFPEFGSVNMLNSDSNSARYDSLVLRSQKRFSAGLTFTASWTYSKNLDGSFGAGNYFVYSNSSVSVLPQNVYNLAAEYGLALSDTPSSFKAGVTYELPFGKGKPMLNSSKFLNQVVGGWSVNTVALLQTGFPLTVFQNQNFNSVIGAGEQRPNATGISPPTSGSTQDRIDNYLNPAAFSLAPQFTFGNLSRTIPVRTPGTRNFDMSLIKAFTVKERFQGQFRAEAINAFNTPQFLGPNTAYGNASFGKITGQGNFPRYIQLGVRFTY